jgi:hypothetical protein
MLCTQTVGSELGGRTRRKVFAILLLGLFEGTRLLGVHEDLLCLIFNAR